MHEKGGGVMYIVETLKKTFESVTGRGKPSAQQLRRSIRRRKAQATMFKDDGSIPNNPKLPFIHYRSPVSLPDAVDGAAVFEDLFRRNGWRDSWRNGIYDYVHYHSSTHEVLGIARGHARVRFGGNEGKVFELAAGDVAILPAGTGHQCLSASKDLLVVGAYPAGGKYDECTGSAAEHARAVKAIAKVPLPAKDPVYGADGPLRDCWKR
jgi:uncharacterized protein YjlB